MATGANRFERSDSSVGLDRRRRAEILLVTVHSSTARRGVRRRDGSRYATLACMQGTSFTPFGAGQSWNAVTGGWLARRWYYTPRSHRAYSIRQVSPGDRRLLAEFALELSRIATERELGAVRELSSLVFDRVLAPGIHDSIGFVALENTSAGDRVIGVCACASAAPGPGGIPLNMAIEVRQVMSGPPEEFI